MPDWIMTDRTDGYPCPVRVSEIIAGYVWGYFMKMDGFKCTILYA